MDDLILEVIKRVLKYFMMISFMVITLPRAQADRVDEMLKEFDQPAEVVLEKSVDQSGEGGFVTKRLTYPEHVRECYKLQLAGLLDTDERCREILDNSGLLERDTPKGEE